MQEYFPEDGTNVYYGRQLEIWLEDTFFHWITKKALNELKEDREINFAEVTHGTQRAHFYWPRKHRYPRRQISEIGRLIEEFSDSRFTRALGQHGEMLADVACAYTGFRIIGKNVREVDGRRWQTSDHNLDRLIERDGVRWGVEIKNTLGYIGQTEFQIKMEMCALFGVRPLFVARMMPKNYILRVRQAGGFALIVKNQHYPMLADDLAKRVTTRLNLPVLCIRELPDKTMHRFVEWHEKHLEG